jgi:hypothetical protein
MRDSRNGEIDRSDGEIFIGGGLAYETETITDYVWHVQIGYSRLLRLERLERAPATTGLLRRVVLARRHFSFSNKRTFLPRGFRRLHPNFFRIVLGNLCAAARYFFVRHICSPWGLMSM